MRRDWRPVAGAVLIGFASGVLGLRWGDALLVGLIAGVVVAVFVVVGAAQPPGWPPARAAETSGTRRDVSALTWSFIGLDGHVTEAAVRRLRVDASRRLAQNGLVVPGGLSATTVRDVDPELQQAARQALGDRAWRILTAPGGSMPSLAEVAHCVEVVERLSPEPAIPPIAARAGLDVAGAAGLVGAARTRTGPVGRQGARAVRGFRTGAPRPTDLSPRTQLPRPTESGDAP